MAKFQLGSKEDSYSFIVPCYGFKDAEQAQACAAKIKPSLLWDAIQPITIGRTSYVPFDSQGYLDTSELTSKIEYRKDANKPIYEVFRSKKTPFPAGSYNVALVVEGPHEFWMSNRGREVGNLSDCFAAWGTRNNAYGIPGGVQLDKCIVRAARSGRGVVFARQAVLGKDKAVRGFKTELVFVEFSILDDEKDKDDLLRITMFNRLAYSYDTTVRPQLPSLDGLDDVWIALVVRAEKGFARYCSPISEDMQRDIDRANHYADQLKKFEADKQFRANVQVLGRDGWQEALKLVTEPWQMLIVVDLCSWQFSSLSNQTYCARVGEMLRQHECTDERRSELRELVYSFASQFHSRLWNYTGD